MNNTGKCFNRAGCHCHSGSKKRTTLAAFDAFQEALGFSNTLLFDMMAPHSERYSQARDNADALATLEAYQTQGRNVFEYLRTRPAAETVP